jgi:hypothetical protein
MELETYLNRKLGASDRLIPAPQIRSILTQRVYLTLVDSIVAPYAPLILRGPQGVALVTEILSRQAQGSAIWTKMMIELSEVRKIRALEPMKLFLEAMPLPGQSSRASTTHCFYEAPQTIPKIKSLLQWR